MSAFGSIESTKAFWNTRRNIFGRQHILSQPAWILGAISLSLTLSLVTSESKETSLHFRIYGAMQLPCVWLVISSVPSLIGAVSDELLQDWVMVNDESKCLLLSSCFYGWICAICSLCVPSLNRTCPWQYAWPQKESSSSNHHFSEGILVSGGCTQLFLLTIVRSALKTPSTHPCKIFGLFAALDIPAGNAKFGFICLLLQNPARCYSKCPDSFWFCDEACMFVRNEHRIWLGTGGVKPSQF